ncbi:hypothetical protein C8J57DRAFT_1169258, partial [Mycena rebaudengoi]
MSILTLQQRAYYIQNQTSLVREARGLLTFAAVKRFALALPFEVTSEIFLHCLPDDEFIVPHPSTAPLLLCHICHRWRQIAFATPLLWTSLRLEFTLFGPPPSVDVAEFYSSWLRNAKNAPLSLDLYAGQGLGLGANFVALLHVIRRLSPQWEQMRLQLDIEWYPELFPADHSVPRLKRLVIGQPSDADDTFPETQFASSLPELQIYHRRNDESFMSAIPSAHFTVLRIDHLTIPECVEVLRDLAYLVDARFHLQGGYQFVPRIKPLPPNTQLRVLTLMESYHHGAISRPILPMQLLHHLTLPDLEDLSINVSPTGVWTPTNLLTALTSFSPWYALKLQHLTLCMVPEGALLECLRSVPTVV